MTADEMDAVRRWLRDDWDHWCCAECRAAWLDELAVPESIREWVSQ